MSLALFSQHYSLAGKTLVMLGGASPLGLPVSETLARAGADMVIAGRSEARGHACVERIRSCGGVGGYAYADLTDRQSLEGLVEYALGEYGKVDGLVQVASSRWSPTWISNAESQFHPAMATDAASAVMLRLVPARPAEWQLPPVVSPSPQTGVATVATHTVVVPCPAPQGSWKARHVDPASAAALLLLCQAQRLHNATLVLQEVSL